MLQIVTRMYFRDGVPLHSTVHREVLFTNCSFLPMGVVVDLPVGELAPSTGMTPVSTTTLSVTEHLEAEDPDGKPSMLVATGGTELVDALADVLSFGLNAVFSRDGELVRRLVPGSLDGASRLSASKLFRHTFDPQRFVLDAELEDLRCAPFRSTQLHLLALLPGSVQSRAKVEQTIRTQVQGSYLYLNCWSSRWGWQAVGAVGFHIY